MSQDLGMPTSVFHLSIPVKDIESTTEVYVNGLGCGVGRQSQVAITLEFQGHQLVAHVTDDLGPRQASIYPRHFGLVCRTEEEWTHWKDRALTRHLPFYREPRQRFSGTPLEHLTFFLEDEPRVALSISGMARSGRYSIISRSARALSTWGPVAEC